MWPLIRATPLGGGHPGHRKQFLNQPRLSARRPHPRRRSSAIERVGSSRIRHLLNPLPPSLSTFIFERHIVYILRDIARKVCESSVPPRTWRILPPVYHDPSLKSIDEVNSASNPIERAGSALIPERIEGRWFYRKREKSADGIKLGCLSDRG